MLKQMAAGKRVAAALAAAAMVLAVVLAGGAALAQEKPAGMSDDIAKMLRDIGPKIEVQQTGAAYAALQPKEPYDDVLVYRDEKYGPAERNVLDVFSPKDDQGGHPILVFVHGGGFTGGTKHMDGSPFYDNISHWAAQNGMVGVQITYRLAPDNKYPSGVEDLDKVVEWLKLRARVYGGDPDKIILWGHSAGASHVADYVAAHANDATKAIDGAVLMSGFYKLDPDQPSVWSSYYGEDRSKYDEMSSLPGLVKTATPLLIVDGGLDLPDANSQADMLARAMQDAGKTPDRVHLANHSHISEAYAVGTADTSLTDPLKAFVMESTAGSD